MRIVGLNKDHVECLIDVGKVRGEMDRPRGCASRYGRIGQDHVTSSFATDLVSKCPTRGRSTSSVECLGEAKNLAINTSV